MLLYKGQGGRKLHFEKLNFSGQTFLVIWVALNMFDKIIAPAPNFDSLYMEGPSQLYVFSM